MGKLYYKATRPDGTDFHTGTVDYADALASGEKLPFIPISPGEQRACCSGAVYHASDVAAETLIGGSWPCRLFLVEGRSVAQEGHKHGFATLRVVEEIEAWQALGSNGREVAALIERAGRLTADEAQRLDAARAAAGYAARAAAWAAAWDAARYAARYAAGYAAWAAARGAARDAAWDAAWAAARDAARDAARGAALALVVKDLISPEHFEVLYGPWRSVVDA